MDKKFTKASSVNIEDLMKDIDNKENFQKEISDFEKSLMRFEQIIADYNRMLGTAEKFKEDFYATMTDASTKAESVLNNLKKEVEGTKKLIIKTEFKPESINTINALHRKFVEDEKNVLDKLAKSRQQQIENFYYNFSNAINRIGFWCSERTFWWLAGIFFLSAGTIIIVITVYIIWKFF